EIVTFCIDGDTFDRLPSVVGQYLVQALTQSQDFAGLNLNIGSLTLGTTRRLVDHDAGVGQRVTLALGSRGKQKRAHAGRNAGAQRGNVRLDELHGVINGHARVYRSARRIDVQRDVFVGILGFEKEQLGDHQVGRLIGYRPYEKD